MIKRLCTSEGWHKTTLNLTRGGLRILAALALAIVLVGANPSWSAQAAPASGMYLFGLTVSRSAKYVCVKQSMTFRVSAYAVRSDGPLVFPGQPGYMPPGKISGVKVDAGVLVKSLGVIEPDSLLIGSQSARPDTAEFTFTAGEIPGEAQILFDGFIPRIWAGISQPKDRDKPIYVESVDYVEVRNCGYRLSDWNYTSNNLKITGGLSCRSTPYGPWDFKVEALTSDGTSWAREVIPWSEDGNTTAIREEYATGQLPFLFLQDFSVRKVTITLNDGGYQINFPASRMVGIICYTVDGKKTCQPTQSDLKPAWVTNIVPAKPGECDLP